MYRGKNQSAAMPTANNAVMPITSLSTLRAHLRSHPTPHHPSAWLEVGSVPGTGQALRGTPPAPPPSCGAVAAVAAARRWGSRHFFASAEREGRLVGRRWWRCVLGACWERGRGVPEFRGVDGGVFRLKDRTSLKPETCTARIPSLGEAPQACPGSQRGGASPDIHPLPAATSTLFDRVGGDIAPAPPPTTRRASGRPGEVRAYAMHAPGSVRGGNTLPPPRARCQLLMMLPRRLCLQSGGYTHPAPRTARAL